MVFAAGTSLPLTEIAAVRPCASPSSRERWPVGRAYGAYSKLGQTLDAAHALTLVAEQVKLAVIRKGRQICVFERHARSMKIDLAPNSPDAVTQCVVDLDCVAPAVAIVVAHLPPSGVLVEGATDAGAARRFGIAMTAEPIKAILTVHPLLDQRETLHLPRLETWFGPDQFVATLCVQRDYVSIPHNAERF